MSVMTSKDDEIARLRQEVERLTRELASSERRFEVSQRKLCACRSENWLSPSLTQFSLADTKALPAYLIDRAPIGVMVKDIDDDFRYVQMNRCTAKWLGVTCEQGIGATDFDWLPREMASRMRDHDLQAVKTLFSKHPAPCHVCRDSFVGRDGQMREWWSLRCPLIQPGKHRLMIVYVTEITVLADQERETQELRARAEFERDRAIRAEQSEAFVADSLREVMALPLGLNALDGLLRRIGEHLQVDRCYVYTCRLYQDVWVTDRVYEWCAEGIPSEIENLKVKGPPGLPEFCDTIDAGEDYAFQDTAHLPPATRAWFEHRQVRSFFATPITDAHGVSIGYLGLDFVKRPAKMFSSVERHNVHEVASIVKLCFTRQKAVEVLQNVEKAKSNFFASISHDIRTPLNSIIGFTQLLQEEKDEKLRNEYLQNIAFSGETLLALVNDVLDLSRLDAGRMTFSRSFFDPFRLLQQVLATFAPTVCEKGIELRSCAAGLPLVALDEKRVRQLLFNLIGNAVKFTDSGHVFVEVAFSPVDDKVGVARLTVQDTGIGMSPRDIDKVGLPYVRLDADSTARGGTGLGLSICHRIIENGGGTMTISSKPGKGTTVLVEMPGVEYRPVGPDRMDDSGSVHELIADAPHDFSALRVLIVDDLEMNRCVLAAACRRLGVGMVQEAASGLEALACLEAPDAAHFDLILTDMKMPGMNGADLISAVKGKDALKDLPIYLVTADVEAARYAHDIGAAGVLLKPVLKDRLRDILASVV